MQIPSERILLLTDASLHPVAGNLHAWPAGVPATPGNYKVKLGSATVASKKPSCTLRTWATTHCWWQDNLLFKTAADPFLVRTGRGGCGAVHCRLIRRHQSRAAR